MSLYLSFEELVMKIVIGLLVLCVCGPLLVLGGMKAQKDVAPVVVQKASTVAGQVTEKVSEYLTAVDRVKELEARIAELEAAH